VVIGIGVDITECARIERMLEKHGQLFLKRVYTPREIDYCTGRKAAVQHYAGRWAAKEAVLKTLGTGWAHGIQWTDAEVVNQQGGKPIIVLAGKALEISAQLGIREIMISISHCQSYAVAYATAIGGEIEVCRTQDGPANLGAFQPAHRQDGNRIAPLLPRRMSWRSSIQIKLVKPHKSSWKLAATLRSSQR
jgi:holo-[acyl-carrier protein] synthase